MIPIKNKREIELMREAGKRLNSVFELVKDFIKAGISTAELDLFIEKGLKEVGLVGECKGYGGFPAVSCISINDVIVHGIPRKTVIIKDGDLVKVDVVGSFKGYCADMARGFFAGKADPVAIELDRVARESFYAAFHLIKQGIRLTDISHAIEKYVKSRGFFIVEEFAGHGIGKRMHEEPEIANFGPPGMGPILMEGMVLAIEPMITVKNCNAVIDSDDWTARTSDGCLAGHFENTVLVTRDGAEILTK